MSGTSSNLERDLLTGAYRDFNARRIDEVLARLGADVEWANGMEGGFVHGREGVRAYWTRQWKSFDPHVEPVDIVADGAGRQVVKVHQVVHDMEGKLLVDTIVYHVYTIEAGLIQRMEIKETEA